MPAFLLVFVAMVLLPAAAAHADEASDVSQAVDLQEQANGLTEKDYALLPQLSELEGRVARIDPASAEGADALPLLEKLAALIDELSASARSIAALYHEAAALDVSPELKDYLRQREGVWRLHLEERTLKRDKTAKLQTLYGKWDSLSEAERVELNKYINATADQEQPLIQLIDEKERASAQYFEDKRLGRRQIDWDSAISDAIGAFWQPILFGLFMIGVLVLSLIAWLVRRLDRGVTVVGKGIGRLFKARPSGVGFQLRGNPAIWAALVLLTVGVSMITYGVLASR